MKKIASNELKDFLQDWLSWVEGCISKVKYHKSIGLCYYAARSGYGLGDEIMNLFDGEEYPFGRYHYIVRSHSGTQHQDPNRLAWVKAALNDTLDTWELME